MNLRTYVGKHVTLHGVTGRVVRVMHTPEGGVTLKMNLDGGGTKVVNLPTLRPLLMARMQYLEKSNAALKAVLDTSRPLVLVDSHLTYKELR